MACRVLSGKDCVITCPFGPRVHPVTGKYSNHNGVDVVGAGYTLASITAHTGGIVEYAGYNSVLGYHVNIGLANGDMMQYCHMLSSLKVKVGDIVTAGQIIGTMGSTGSSTGAHLHFGIQKDGQWIDPEPYLYVDCLEETMSEEQFYQMFLAAVARYTKQQNDKPAGYAQETWDRLTQAGVMDGTRPCAPVERREFGLVIERLGLLEREV